MTMGYRGSEFSTGATRRTQATGPRSLRASDDPQHKARGGVAEAPAGAEEGRSLGHLKGTGSVAANYLLSNTFILNKNGDKAPIAELSHWASLAVPLLYLDGHFSVHDESGGASGHTCV